MEAYLREHIPLSAAMGCRVLRASREEVLLEAPLTPNLNHRDTAFGGSLSALAILAGWAMVHFRLRGEGLHVRTVIQESSVRYNAPVHGAFRARCGEPSPRAWERFVRAVRRRGKGRIQVSVQLTSGGEPVADYSGTYVALASREADAAL